MKRKPLPGKVRNQVLKRDNHQWGGERMKQGGITRYTWTKEEIRILLVKDLAAHGINIEGETALSLDAMVIALEVWMNTPLQSSQDG